MKDFIIFWWFLRSPWGVTFPTIALSIFFYFLSYFFYFSSTIFHFASLHHFLNFPSEFLFNFPSPFILFLFRVLFYTSSPFFVLPFTICLVFILLFRVFLLHFSIVILILLSLSISTSLPSLFTPLQSMYNSFYLPSVFFTALQRFVISFFFTFLQHFFTPLQLF